ncbi:MAG: type I secretion system permease/ATPase [Candidatus Marinimicrobia bacterium]|nr:type I secretion system permease/ATPase [Candidatus Neomarinimicrobiota bacterium]|tara:strand:+ start:1786 stop:3483 length:1698 start_codon:yes stop_codon:yes gene_type:complete
MNAESKKIKDHWFWGTALKNKGIYLQVALASILINVFALMSAFYIMTVYDRVLPNNAMESLLALTIGIAVVIIFDFILKMLRGYFIDIAGIQIEEEVNERLFKKIVGHDPRLLGSGSNVIQTVKEFEGVRDFFTSASLAIFIDLPFMFIFVGVLYAIGGWVALVPTLIIPLVLGVAALVQPILRRYGNENMKVQTTKMRSLIELTSNMETVRSIAGGSFLKDRWSDSTSESAKIGLLNRVTANFALNFATTSLQVSMIGIVVVGVFLVSSLKITTGALIACVILSGRVLSPLVQTGQLLTRLNGAITAFKNVNELMKEESRDETLQDVKGVIIDSGSVKLKNLEYSINESKILENINLSIKDGEKFAVVGPLGCGKSTLLRSIIGYHLPPIGTAFLGDYDINNIPSTQLRSNIGYCPQQIQLFSGSIYENIAAGFDEASEENVVEAAKAVGAHEFIATLPKAYYYDVSEQGLNLSGGQRQSIALARALIRKPRLLVLDEPTSSMDTDSEMKVINHIFNLDYKPTIIIATHNANHLLNVDTVAIMVNGQISRVAPRDEVVKTQSAN